MPSFPSPKVHRTSRRKLGRGQHAPVPTVSATPVATLAVVVITFGQNVIINGPINLNVAGVTVVSQVVNSPTQVTITYSATVVGKTWTLAPGDPSIRTFQGGGPTGGTGTF